jgi:hypothetical protein
LARPRPYEKVRVKGTAASGNSAVNNNNNNNILRYEPKGKVFGSISERVEVFCFVISGTGLMSPDTKKDDDCDDGSSVGIATGWTTGVRFLGGERFFSSP